VAEFKMVHQFTEAGFGFAEVWYRTAGTLEEAAVIPAAVKQAAIIFRNSLVRFDKVRVSSVDNNRIATIARVNLSAPFSNSSPSVNNTCVVYKVASPTVGASRNIWVRGLDQNAFGRAPTSGADRPSGAIINSIHTYLLELQKANYRVRALRKTTETGMAYRSVTDMVAVADRGTVKLLYTGDAVAVGSRIICSQFNKKDFPGLQGKFTVQAGSIAGEAIIKYNYHYAGTFSAKPALF